MPTIEIVSLKTTGLEINQDNFNLAVIEESVLKSHRGLFFDFLSEQQGIIIHIGNPDLKYNLDGGFFAGNIINWEFEDPNYEEKKKNLVISAENNWANQDFLFQFENKFKNEIKKLMQIAINKSPIHKIYFLTDYQFGPEKAEFKFLNNLKDFWKEHDQNGLNWNTLYEIGRQKA